MARQVFHSVVFIAVTLSAHSVCVVLDAVAVVALRRDVGKVVGCCPTQCGALKMVSLSHSCSYDTCRCPRIQRSARRASSSSGVIAPFCRVVVLLRRLERITPALRYFAATRGHERR